MATLENNLESNPCPHCGHAVRPGMVRCRECRGLLVDTGSEFTVSSRVQVLAQPACGQCGTALEAAGDHCPHCAAALLDDLLKGPADDFVKPVEARESALRGMGAAELRLRAQAAADRTREDEWVPLRELSADADTSVPVSDQAGAKSVPARIPGKGASRPQIRKPQRRQQGAAAAKAEATVETSSACAALLASLGSADPNLRVEIATALGKLGDKAAVAPLERHMVDPEVEVRRAVAAALVQLGHAKGKTLLDIAERTPAAAVLSGTRSTAAVRPRRSGGGFRLGSGVAAKLTTAFAAVALIAGGSWYATSNASAPARRTRKAKAVSAKRLALQAPVARFGETT